jgi:hypothetical protein
MSNHTALQPLLPEVVRFAHLKKKWPQATPFRLSFYPNKSECDPVLTKSNLPGSN